MKKIIMVLVISISESKSLCILMVDLSLSSFIYSIFNKDLISVCMDVNKSYVSS